MHAQTGPLIGYTPGQGVMVGWEGGAGAGFAGAALGAEVRPFGEALTKFYLAFEPGFAVPVHENSSTRTEYFASSGGTGGVAIDERGSVAPVLGAWLGGVSLQGGDCHERWARTFSISVGFHMFLDRPEREWTVYATPKLGTVGECVHFNFPQ
ncbi:MAG TPA: hypothetical protein VJV78_01050 [Polyangiales bacterium]|nr:hypothetical protein [Polyangiales bacterium]